MRKHLPFYLFLLLALMLTACSAGASYEAESPAMDMDAGGGYAMAEGAPAAPMEESSRSYDDSVTNTSSETIERLVIKNANLSVAVEDPVAKMDQIMAMAEEMGGFVVSSNLWYYTLENGVEVPQGDVMIRVPSNLFDEALTAVKNGVGQVVNEGVSGQDVTQEYTDLQSRIKNLEAAETELQRIMEEASKTEDVLNVYNRLIDIREQIEVLKGRVTYFEQSAAFSAISVSVLADEAVQPLTIGGWEPVGVAKDAVQALIDTFKVIVNVLIWLALYVLPIFALLYFVFVIVRRIYRSLFKRSAVKAPETPGE